MGGVHSSGQGVEGMGGVVVGRGVEGMGGVVVGRGCRGWEVWGVGE